MSKAGVRLQNLRDFTVRIRRLYDDAIVGTGIAVSMDGQIEEGGSIVEVDEPAPEGGVVRTARPGEIAAKAGQTFEAALERIKPVAGTIIAKLRGLSDPPGSKKYI